MQQTFPRSTLSVLTSKLCLIIRGSPQLPYANAGITNTIERDSFLVHYMVHPTILGHIIYAADIVSLNKPRNKPLNEGDRQRMLL